MKYINLPDYTINVEQIVEIYWSAGDNYPAIYKDYKKTYSKKDLEEVIPEAQYIEKAVMIHFNSGHVLTLMDAEEYGWNDYTLFKEAWEEHVKQEVSPTNWNL